MGDQSDDSDQSKQLRGTLSRGNPFNGKAPSRGDDEAIITIQAPDGSIRKYELTDDVKDGYEKMIETKFDNAEVFWYEMWWDGTELVIEYEGCIRDESLRPDYEDIDPRQYMQMMMQGQRPKSDGIPKREADGKRGDSMSMRDQMRGKRPEPSVTINLNEQEDPDYEQLDEGVIPVINRTRIDIQKRANENPMAVEDLFVKPWSDETQMPINSEHEDGELDDDMFEVDFRNETNDEDTTVSDGARGDRWNL